MKNRIRLDLFLVFGALPIVTLLFFQNCGNVKVQAPEAPAQPSIQAKGISGKICASTSPVTTVSRYELTHFVIVNMTALTKNSALEADSNANGIVDRIESNLNEIPPIKISKTDTDADGIPDFIEEVRGMSQKTDDLFIDGTDGDGKFNLQELIEGSDPTSADSPPELNLYKLTEISAEDGCDKSQKTYQFNIENLQRVSVAPLIDSTNSGEASLSHEKDENVFLVYALLTPDRVTEKPQKLYKIFKVKKDDKDFFLEMKISDYLELPAL